MKYTLNQLQIFLKIVDLKSVTKASEELHLTQPAVSIQLKNFQNQFEIPLTEVVGRKLYVTEFGQEIAEAARKIIEQVNAIDYKTMAYKGELVGKLHISIVSTGKYVMPYFLSSFVQSNKAIQLNMDVTNKSKVIKHLENNQVDFALVSILPEHLQLERLDLLTNDLMLIGKNKIPNTSKVPAVIMRNLPLIFREEGSGTRSSMERFLRDQEVSVIKKMELTTNEAVKQALIAGLGYSIMPIIGLKNELENKQLEIIEVKGLPIQTNWSLVWLKGKNLSPVAKAFLSHIKTHKDEIIKNNFSWYSALNNS
jgi:DNA-binding transcriptional LysR family regulator